MQTRNLSTYIPFVFQSSFLCPNFRTKEAFVVKLLQTVVPGSEEDQNLSGDLFKKCLDEKMLTKENVAKVGWARFKYHLYIFLPYTVDGVSKIMFLVLHACNYVFGTRSHIALLLLYISTYSVRGLYVVNQWTNCAIS